MSVKSMQVMQKVEDLIGNFISWPVWSRELMLSHHLVYSNRFKLTLFLLGNALPPSVIREWYVAQGCLRDQSAWRHVEKLIADFKQDKLDKCTFFDMWLGERVDCSAPRGIDWNFYR